MEQMGFVKLEEAIASRHAFHDYTLVPIRFTDHAVIPRICAVLNNPNCPQGLELGLSGNNLGAGGARAFADALATGRCPQGLRLDLSENNLGAEGAHALAYALATGRCPQGLRLNLNGNDLGALGALALADALATGRCPQGLWLDLASNDLGLSGARDLADALATGRCPQGLWLDLASNDLGAEAVRVLANALSSSRIINVIEYIHIGYLEEYEQRVIDEAIQRTKARINSPVWIEEIERRRIADLMLAQRPVSVETAQPLLQEHLIGADAITREANQAYIQLRNAHEAEKILQIIRPRSREAAQGLLAERYRFDEDLSRKLCDIAYRPTVEDLSLLNQIAFFLQRDSRSRAIRERIAEVLPPQLSFLIVDVTASDDISDLLAHFMIFISHDTLTCMTVSYEYFAKFILHDTNPLFNDVQWGHIYLFRKASREEPYVAIPPRDLSELFNLFPLFRGPYLASRNVLLPDYIQRKFGHNEVVFPSIRAAMNSPSSGRKLIDFPQQEALMTLLIPSFRDGFRDNHANVNLTSEALAEIFQIFEYTDRPQAEKNFLLFGLALFFVTLSSSRFLGTDDDSPLAIRLFAIAILNSITPEAPFFAEIVGWKNRLFGEAFSCTDILSTIMRTMLTGMQPNIFNLVYPQAWR